MHPNEPKRSALTDYPTGICSSQPTVTAVIPVYNEIEHIARVVDALLAQDYPALTAIWFVDGQSDDGTYAVLQQLQKRDPRIQILTNSRRTQATALNLAFAQAKTDIVIRLDGHAHYAPSVIRCSVQALLATGAGGVGAIARPVPAATLIGQSIVAAHTSKLGVGAAQFRQEAAKGWVDTVWNGCYWRHVVEQVGPFREDLPRTEDNDFHARVRALGYGLYLSPEIQAFYYPRQSLWALWRQYMSNGIGIAQTLFTNRQAISLRHLAPAALVLSLILDLALAFLWPPAWFVFAVGALVYLAAVLSFTVIAWRKEPGLYVFFLPWVFATLHFSYGFGTLRGFLQKH
ncbi:MAG: glycosyltransferase family 2 protein [Chloroflexi bacterium]|nr:glycosyltransferase family 2 protein [Chloroflexota bacterium]